MEQSDSISAERLLQMGFIHGYQGNKAEARECFKRSADAGNLEAMYKYAETFYTEDVCKYVQLLTDAATKGSGKAAFYLGLYYSGKPDVDDYERVAGDWMLKAYKLGCRDRNFLDTALDYYKDGYIYFKDDHQVCCMAEDALASNIISQDTYEKVKARATSMIQIKAEREIAKRCPKCMEPADGTMSKQSPGKGAAIGGGYWFISWSTRCRCRRRCWCTYR